ILLDEETHVYRVDGRIVRGFHEMMAPLGLWDELASIPAHWLENAKKRGAQVHDACALIMEGREEELNAQIYDLDDDACAAWEKETEPYVAAYRAAWLDPACHSVIGSIVPTLYVETPLYCAELDFCCTPDWHTILSVNDIKTQKKPSRTW